MLVYFGFTYCPDVCPTDLQAMGLAIDQLGAAGDAVQPVFITVDPERDTPDHLKDYMPLFHPRFVGLTGNAVAIEEAARAYRVYYKKVEREDKSDYTVDHTTVGLRELRSDVGVMAVTAEAFQFCHGGIRYFAAIS